MAPGGGNGDVRRIRERRQLRTEIRDVILREFILSGQVPPGERLPSEAELGELFGASRVTIRAALQSLRDLGYIRIVRGAGSHVLPRPESIQSGLDRLSSFDTFARQAGAEITTADVVVSQEPADEEWAHDFGIPVGASLTKLSRTKVIGVRKAALIVDYVPEQVMSMQSLVSAFQGSVLDVLLARPGLVEYTDCVLTPVVADTTLAAALDTEPGGPYLRMSEWTRSSDGALVNRSEAWLDPVHFTFRLRRRVEV